MKRRVQPVIGLLLALALVASACTGGGGGKKTGGGKGNVARTVGGKVTISPLFFQDLGEGKAKGGTSPTTVRLSTSADSKFRVGFTEDEVAGTGDQWRAAGWGATTVATLLTGSALTNREVTFDVTGKIDGPSAGGLMTVAVLALTRGDALKPDITMTGTINPDGTIGPVGGIPYKVDGVVDAKKKRMLIPTGQRNSSDTQGNLVDIVEAGRKKGIEVSEVKDVYEAYKAFTGKDLPRPAEAGDVKLDEQTYAKLKARTESWLAKYQQSVGEFGSLDPTIQTNLQSIGTEADSNATTAKKLADEGLQAGAYQKAVLAAALANAAVKTGQNLQVLLTQGAEAFASKIKGSLSISGQINGLVDSLKTVDPQTVSDAAALVSAYGDAIDAISLSTFGDSQLTAPAPTPEQVVQQATVGAVYYELAGTLAEAAHDSLEVGRGLGGAGLAKGTDLSAVADFFRRAAEANLTAFETVVVAPAAQEANVSAETAKANFAGNEIEYALAKTGLNVIGGLQQYFGDVKTSAYAELGGALGLYARTSGLLAKYYSLAQIDTKTLQVTGIKHDKALAAALELGQGQLARTVSVLRSKKVDPALVVAAYEVAGVDREGTASDKLDALSEYWAGFVGGRMLAYLGGFPTDGLK